MEINWSEKIQNYITRGNLTCFALIPQLRTMAPTDSENNATEETTPEDQVMESADSEAESSKMTMEERKAKMDQLRKRLVSIWSLTI